jgi:hypothetical protein
VGHYDVLGVARDASPDEVRRAYLALAREHHPDRVGGSHDRMRAVNEAWATLSDPGRRRTYDRSLAPAPRPQPAPSARPAPPPYQPADDLDDLLDDRPINGAVVKLPGWIAMLPPGLLLLSVAVWVFGLVLQVPGILAVAVICGLLSLLLFATSPLLALHASRRRPSRR